MLTIERLEHQSAWFFRQRGKIFLVTLLLLALQVPDHHDWLGSARAETGWMIGCLVMALVGQGLRIVTIGSVARGTSGRRVNDPAARTLNSTGMYSLVRNPLYVGNAIVHLSLLATTRSVWSLVVMALLLVIYFERILLAEESLLRKQFGQVYEDWARTTPAFFPKLGPWVKPDVPFRWRMVLRREAPGVTAIFLAFFVIRTAYAYALSGQLVLETAWLVPVIVCLVFYAGIKLLRGWTSVLEEDQPNAQGAPGQH